MDWREGKAGNLWDATNAFWGACRGAAGYVADRLNCQDPAYRAHLAQVAITTRPDLRLNVLADYTLDAAWLVPQPKPFDQPIWGDVEQVRQLAMCRPFKRHREGRITVVRPSDGCYPSDVVACALCLDAATPVPTLEWLLKQSGHLLTTQLVEGVASRITHFRDNPAEIGHYRRETRFFFEGTDRLVYVGRLYREGGSDMSRCKWGLTANRLDAETSRLAPPANYLFCNWAAWPLSE